MGRKSNIAVSLCCEGEYKKGDEMALVQFIEGLPPLDTVNDALTCVRLRFAAAECGENETDGNRMEGVKIRMAGREWLGVILFESVLSIAHVARASNAVHPVTTELASPCYRF